MFLIFKLCRSYGSMVSDPYVKVYDVRMMKALPPVSLAIDHPLLLRFLPSYSSRLLVMSATGRAQIIDPSQQKSENNSILQVIFFSCKMRCLILINKKKATKTHFLEKSTIGSKIENRLIIIFQICKLEKKIEGILS